MSSCSAFADLVDWIVSHGGYVHRGLSINYEDERNNRCVVASQEVQEGELLVRLPALLALSGQRKIPTAIPSHKRRRRRQDSDASNECDVFKRPYSDRSKILSPWMRCPVALIYVERNVAPASENNGDCDGRADDSDEHKITFRPYSNSLPQRCETLLD